MNYVELNSKIREVVNGNKGVVGKMKLPNTVFLQFRKDESKLLSIQSMLKFINGLGYDLDLRIIDNEGNEVSTEALAAKCAEISPITVKKKNDTLALIAGASTEEVEEETKAEVAQATEAKEEAEVAQATEAKEEAEVSESTEAKEETEEEKKAKEAAAKAAEDSLKFDLSEVFGG